MVKRSSHEGPGKVGTRSGIPAVKRRTSRTARHASKRVLSELAADDDGRADARLADQTYRGSHPEPVIEAIVLSSGKPGRNKRSAKDLTPLKKRAAEALQKQLETEARLKAQRKAKRRAAARALKKARQP